MKGLLISTVFLIILTSLCIDIPTNFPINIGPTVNQTNNPLSVSSDSQDISFKVDVSVSDVRAGRPVQLFFETRNKQGYELRNVNVSVYDNPCLVNGEFFNNTPTLKANQTKMWTLSFKTDSAIEFQKNCPIKFKFSYETVYSLFQDLAILSEGEYIQRDSSGTLGNIPISSTSSNSPLNVGITFSDKQPLIVNTIMSNPYFMYINYYNNGQGIFKSIDVSITPSANMNNLRCYLYKSEGNKLRINSPSSIIFIKGKATPTTCNFTTSNVASMDIKSLSLTANYKYVLDNSITIVVKP